MKKLLILLVMATICSGMAAAQVLQPEQPGRVLLKKSERRTKAGVILLASAPVLIVTPLLIGPSVHVGDATPGIVYGIMVTGFLFIPLSITYFIAGSAARKKAMRLGLTSLRIPPLSPGKSMIPAVTLKLDL